MVEAVAGRSEFRSDYVGARHDEHKPRFFTRWFMSTNHAARVDPAGRQADGGFLVQTRRDRAVDHRAVVGDAVGEVEHRAIAAAMHGQRQPHPGLAAHRLDHAPPRGESGESAVRWGNWGKC